MRYFFTSVKKLLHVLQLIFFQEPYLRFLKDNDQPTEETDKPECVDTRVTKNKSKHPLKLSQYSKKNMTTLGGPVPVSSTTLAQAALEPNHKKPKKRRPRNKNINQNKTIHIDGQDFTIIKQLGKGAYGTVEKVEDEEGYSFAIKRVEFKPSRGVYADIIKEMDILRRFASHPNVIGLCGYAWGDREFVVLMEYGGMPLHRYISNVEYHERMDALPMVMWQILSALTFLHDCGICHRDVKPDNILVQEFEEDDGFIIPYLRLCDFGLSKNMALKRNTPKTSTLWYRAPENLQKLERYGYKIDVWAAGCILYEYITGDVLFEGNNSNQCLLKIISSLGPLSDRTYSRLQIDRSKLPRRYRKHTMKPIDNGAAKRIMLCMLTVDPGSRPNARELLQDDFFKRPVARQNVKRIETFINEEREIREADQTDMQMQNPYPLVANPAYNAEVRRALVKWLLEIQQADKDETHPQTVFLGIELFDDVMSKWGPLDSDSDLKYIALTCLNIASKYLELGLDLDFVYSWNHKKFHEHQGVPRCKIPEPKDKEIDDYIVSLNSYEQRGLMLLDFRIGGRKTALDRNGGNYIKACSDAMTYRTPEPPVDSPSESFIDEVI